MKERRRALGFLGYMADFFFFLLYQCRVTGKNKKLTSELDVLSYNGNIFLDIPQHKGIK